MFKILTLNNISVAGLDRLPRDRYEIASEIQHPDAVLVRSHNMHEMPIPETLKAIGRAGAGVNNIPVARMSERGIVVFNAPGANANAVKELVIAGMLLAARNIVQAWDFARGLEGTDAQIRKAAEGGKKQFVGFELPGRTLGVVGLGAIGVKVANAAIALGMRVVGYDPDITVTRAWQLSSDVQQAASLDDLFARSDFVSFHVPLVEGTRGMVDAKRLRAMRDGAVLLNFAREEIVHEQAIADALAEGKLRSYVCDFPGNTLRGNPRAVMLPHIGASTLEAEENCAVMVADQVRAYLEDGSIHNSVNFPEVEMTRSPGAYRVAVVNANVPNMLGQISTTLARAGLNILDMLNKSRGGVAFTLADVEAPVPAAVIGEIRAIEGVLAVRTL
jgi:D-3-phosphoglycerate dehydrogenase